MATEVLMPQMGESIAEGTITRWLVKVGDEVERDQPLFEISTDKVDAEIPSPASGVLLERRGEEGDTIAVNEVVAMIGEEGESVGEPEPEPEPEADADAEPDAEAEAEEAGEAARPETEEAAEEREAEDAGAEDAGAGEEGADDDGATEEASDEDDEAAEGRRPDEGEAAEAEPEDSEREAESEPASTTDEEAEVERIRTASSPVVRKIAAEHGIDISEVEGTGIHGRVTKRDILDFVESRAEEEPAAKPAAAEPSPTEVIAAPPQRPTAEGFYVPPYVEGERVEIEPMSKIRQITAAHMTYSKATSAHVTTVFHMDLARVHRERERAKAGFQEAHGTKLTYMPFIFKAVATALQANPKLNAAIDGTDIVYKKEINIGMAVALDWGLLVPVIRNADQLNLVGLARTANDLADRARAKKLSPDELKGGTFTITNPGVFGTLFGTPIINQPQVAILGLGAIEKRPVVVTDEDGNDTIVIKPMSYFAISYDHRLVDGADADKFMNHVKRTLVEESWSELDAF